MRKAKLFDGKRTVQNTINERDYGHARILDYNKHRDVFMHWKQSKEMADNQIFVLEIRTGDDVIELFLDAQEFQRYLRWV